MTRRLFPNGIARQQAAALGWFFLALCLFLVTAATGVMAAESGRETVILGSGFETDDWWKAWGLKEPPRNADIVTVDPERKFQPLSGGALRIKVRKGEHTGASIEYRFKRQIGAEPEEIFFRYYLRLGDDWTPVEGGKLPGIAGTYWRAGWGGRRVDGTDGWSARGLFGPRKEGRTPIGFYTYHMDMRGNYGSHWVWDRDELGFLENNRWYCIEQQVRLNTPGEANGIMRGWVDGKLAFEKADVRMRSVDTLKIEMVWVNVYHGGTNPAAADHHLYMDDVIISREPIGPRKD